MRLFTDDQINEFRNAIETASPPDLWGALSALTISMNQAGKPDGSNKSFMLLYRFYRLLAWAIEEKNLDEELRK